MVTLTPKPLSKEAFQKYGEYFDLKDDAALSARSGNPGGFFPDVIWMDWGGQTPPTVSVCQANKPEQIVVSFIELHKYTHEGLLPIDGDVVIYVGRAGFGGIEQVSANDLECFIVPQGTYVKLFPHTLHGSQFSISGETVHVLCQLPARTYANDMLFKIVQDDAEKGVIAL